MTAYAEAKAKIEAVINEVLAEESSHIQIETIADHMSASVCVDGRKTIVLDYFKYSDDAYRKLKINWSCVGSVDISDHYLCVLAKILANAAALEAKICRGEIGELLYLADVRK